MEGCHDVAFLPFLCNLNTTFLTNCGRSQEISINTCTKIVVGSKVGAFYL